MATEFLTANIHLKSPTYDLSVLGSLKNTHRILLKFIHARYTVDQDLQFILYYKRLYSNIEEILPFTISKDNEYFKQKLPPAILVREYRYEIFGMDLSAAEIIESGVLWTPVRIGAS